MVYVNYYCTGWIIPLPGWIITSHLWGGNIERKPPPLSGHGAVLLGRSPSWTVHLFWRLQVTTGVFLYESERICFLYYKSWHVQTDCMVLFRFLTFPNWLYLVSWPIRWSYLWLFQVQLAGGNAEAADTRAEPLGPKKQCGFDHQNMEINRGIYISNKNGDLLGFNSTNMAIYIKAQVQLDKCCLNFGR